MALRSMCARVPTGISEFLCVAAEVRFVSAGLVDVVIVHIHRVGC